MAGDQRTNDCDQEHAFRNIVKELGGAFTLSDIHAINSNTVAKRSHESPGASGSFGSSGLSGLSGPTGSSFSVSARDLTVFAWEFQYPGATAVRRYATFSLQQSRSAVS